MARRYVDGRQSYATGLFNDHVRDLLALGIELNPTGDGTIWARDRMGRRYDGLTDKEASMGVTRNEGDLSEEQWQAMKRALYGDSK